MRAIILQRGLTMAALILVVGLSAMAQTAGVDEDTFFGSDNGTATASPVPTIPPAAGSTESDFFNSGSPEASGKTADSTYKETFTTQKPIQFGGNFKLKMTAGLDYYRDFGGWTWPYFFSDKIEIPGVGFPSATGEKVEDSNLDLEGSLYFSARPTNTLRIYGKAKVTYPFATALNGLYVAASSGGAVTQPLTGFLPNIQIWELFADFNIADSVFFRAGKQMIKWGANAFAFWSPADVLSIGSIDINNRGQDLEGPFAIKANVPFGNNNLDFYVIAPANQTITSVSQMGVAGRAKFLFSGWELGAGAVYQENSDLKLVATASGSLWKFELWGEGLVQRTATNLVINNNGGGIYSIGNPRSDWFFSGTAGISYANPDIYLDTVMLQYYFNGTGTADMAGAAQSVRGYLGYVAVTAPNALAQAYTNVLAGSSWPGRHYLALTASESFVHEGKVHLLATWLANLSDGSGFISPGVNFDITDEIILGILFTVNYGNLDTQFGGLNITGFHQPRFKMGMSLTLGTGNF